MYEQLLAEVVRAYDRCDSNRGRFSCTEMHDGRCNIARKIEGPCVCGSDELEAALEAARKVIA